MRPCITHLYSIGADEAPTTWARYNGLPGPERTPKVSMPTISGDGKVCREREASTCSYPASFAL
jgi:hypothetical protein